MVDTHGGGGWDDTHAQPTHLIIALVQGAFIEITLSYVGVPESMMSVKEEFPMEAHMQRLHTSQPNNWLEKGEAKKTHVLRSRLRPSLLVLTARTGARSTFSLGYLLVTDFHSSKHVLQIFVALISGVQSLHGSSHIKLCHHISARLS